CHRRDLGQVSGLRIDLRGGEVNEMSRGFDLSRHVGEHELDPLEAGNRLSELLPLLRVIQRIVERAFGYAERLGADSRSRSIKNRERDLETRSLLTQTIGRRDFDVVEHELR